MFYVCSRKKNKNKSQILNFGSKPLKGSMAQKVTINNSQ